MPCARAGAVNSARKKLFAGAGFSGNQNRGIGVRNFGGKYEYRTDFFVRPNDAHEIVIRGSLQLVELAAELMEISGATKNKTQLLHRSRLHKVVVRARS